MSITSAPRAVSHRAALLVAVIALATDMLIYGIAVPVLPLFPAVARGGPAATGLLFATYAAGLLILTAPAGRLVDRSGPRSPLILGMLLLGAATLVFSVSEPLWLLALARAAQGGAAAVSWVAGLALISATSPPATRARDLGFALSAVSLGVLLGPPLGGFLAEAGGRHLPFLVGAALAVLDGVLRIALVRSDPARPTDDPGRIRDVGAVRGAAAVCAAVALGAGILALTEPVLPPRLADLGVAPGTTGVVFGAAVLASACTTPVVGFLADRIPVWRPMLAGGLIAAGGLLLIATSMEVSGVTGGLVVVGVGSGAVLAAATPAISVLGSRSRPPAIGAAFAVFNLAYAVGLFLGPAVAGILTARCGFSAALVLLASAVGAMSAIISAIVAWRLGGTNSG